MLIDDDLPTNYLSKILLQKIDCCDKISMFTMATDAIVSLEEKFKANQTLPDAILLDLNMPRMNGWEFIQELTQLPVKPSLPKIYIITTSMNPEDEATAKNIPTVAGFYQKPLDEKILDNILATF